MNEENKQVHGNDSRALTIRHTDIDTSLNTLDLFNPTQLEQAEVFLKKIMATDKGGIKSINEGLAILMRAKDLNLPFSTCIEHIHVINGKTGVDIHIIKSLLLRAGVTWECTKDYAPQYQYTDGNTIYLQSLLPEEAVVCRTPKEAESKTDDSHIGVYPLRYYADLKNNLYNEFEYSSQCEIAINKQHALKLAKEGKFPLLRVPAQPIDFITEYKFTRYRKVNDKEIVSTCTSHFSLSDARKADLLTKDTYVKYAQILVGHRAFTLGARDIASDLIMGCMESGELKLVEGIDLSPSDYEIIEDNQT